jgi:hypothetical protein
LPNKCDEYDIQNRLGIKSNQRSHMRYYGVSGAVYLGIVALS